MAGASTTTIEFELGEDLQKVTDEVRSKIDQARAGMVAVDDTTFAVSLIPTTLAHTTLGTCRAGDVVNIEVDVIAKYVERLMEGRAT